MKSVSAMLAAAMALSAGTKIGETEYKALNVRHQILRHAGSYSRLTKYRKWKNKRRAGNG